MIVAIFIRVLLSLYIVLTPVRKMILLIIIILLRAITVKNSKLFPFLSVRAAIERCARRARTRGWIKESAYESQPKGVKAAAASRMVKEPIIERACVIRDRDFSLSLSMSMS